MSGTVIVFYALAICMLVAAVLSVTTRMIFRSAIWLLFSLLGIAGLYVWMDLPFLAAVQVVVYVGGIVVLIIFSIFLTQQSGRKMAVPRPGRWIFALLATLFGAVFATRLFYRNSFEVSGAKPFSPDVADIGTQLLSTSAHGYVLPFEVVSMLLLAAMIGCIVIAMQEKQVE